MKRLYFDTETIGKIPREPTPLEALPHIVQLGAILWGDRAGLIQSMEAIIHPNGWMIPDEAAAVHGITQEMAENFGVPILFPLGFFSHLCRQADEIIAHNIDFDLKMVSAELERLGKPNLAKEVRPFCTMLGSKNHCKIPGLYKDWKWPKLEEAYKHFFGEELTGAHKATADLLACQRIHQHLISIGDDE